MAERRIKKDLSKVFIFSGLTDFDRKELTKKVVYLGAKFLDLKDFKTYCTHVITSKLTKSEKVLGGMATGKWILHPDYIHDSHTAGNWLDEEQYEFCDEKIRRNYPTEIDLSFAPRRWRFELGEHSYAFTGWKVAVVACAKKAIVIKRLLISGGADVYKLKLPIKRPEKIADTIAYVFVSEQNAGLVAPLFEYGILCLKPEYIGDYLIKYPPPDVMDYLVSLDGTGHSNNQDVPVSQDSSHGDSFLALTQTSNQLSQTSTPDHNTGQQDYSSLLSLPSSPLLKQPVIQKITSPRLNKPFSPIPVKAEDSSVVKTHGNVHKDEIEIETNCDSVTATNEVSFKFKDTCSSLNRGEMEKCLRTAEQMLTTEGDSLIQVDHKQRCDQMFSEEESSIVNDATPRAQVAQSSKASQLVKEKFLGKKLNISITQATASPKQVTSPITNFFKPIFTRKVEKECSLNEAVVKALATSTPVSKGKENRGIQQGVADSDAGKGKVSLEERVKLRGRRRRTANQQNCKSNMIAASSVKAGNFRESNKTDFFNGPTPGSTKLLQYGEHGMKKRTSDHLVEILTDLKRKKCFQRFFFAGSLRGCFGVELHKRVTASEWVPLAFAYNQRECEETEDSMRLPVTMTEIVHSMLEEGFHMPALNELYNRVSLRCLPATRTLHSLLFQVLQNSQSQIEANCAYEVFMKVLRLHPPITHSLQQHYLDVLAPHTDGENIIGAEWNAILEMMYSIMDEADMQKKRNSKLMLSITRYMIQQNFQHFIKSSEQGTKHMLMKIVWCPSYHVVFNSRCRQLFDAMMQAITLYRAETDQQRKQCLLELLEDTMWFIAVVTETCRLSECGSVCGIKYLSAEKTAIFILKISERLIEADITDPSLLQSLLSMLQMPWLCVGICQHLLNTLTDCLLTDEMSLDTKPVTLRHIVRRYLFLLPRFHQDHPNHTGRISSILREMKTGDRKTISENNHKENKTENEKLLKKAHKRNPKGETALHKACIKNDLASLRELLKIPGINVNIKDNAGFTPLHEASYRGSMDCLQELLKFVPIRTVELYMNEGTNQSKKVDLLAADSKGLTPLHEAVRENRVEICRVLLQHGGQRLLKAKTCWGYTAFDFALEYASEEMYQLLCSVSQNPKRNENDSQDFSFMDSQESTSSTEDCGAVEPSDLRYNEVLYRDGKRLYAHTKHLLQYLHLIKIFLDNYFQTTNLLVILEKLRAKKKDAVPATFVSSQEENSVIETDKMIQEEVQEHKRDLKVLRKLPQYVKMFRSHLSKLCRPEDWDMVKKECLLLSLYADFGK